MSNHLAVAAATATLAHVLRGPVQQAVQSAVVLTDRPGADGGAQQSPEVRVFLYRVHPNPAWRNQDLPTRGGTGAPVARPQAALDLEYLLTFQGDERALEPQRLLGAVVRELHVRPLLGRDQIRAVADAADSPVATTDLADQPERVRFTPLSLELEELSKLWSVFFQTTYRLSMAYRASVVLISPDTAAAPAPPVVERRLVTTTIRRPVIERVVPADGKPGPVVVGQSVRITGSQLSGPGAVVWFGSERADPAPAAIGDREITASVPDTVRAGLLGVRVEHRLALGEPPTERSAGTSAIVPLAVRPTILSIAGGATGLQVTVAPAVGRRQRVEALLTRRDPVPDQPPSYRFPAASRDVAGAPEQTDELVVPLPGVAAGSYLVSLQVDGVVSALERDTDPDSPTFERFVGPAAELP